MNNRESFAVGFLLGAGVTYLFDPDRGRRRRALLRDQVDHTRHEADETLRAGARHLRNRAVGTAHELKAELTETGVEDRVLEERVRSEIGRKVSNPGAIDVSASAGRVTLSGDIASKEVQDAVRAARSVRGVRHLDNHLRVDTHPETNPNLQGARRQS
jgi:osmotically-inducible protein OsmY